MGHFSAETWRSPGQLSAEINIYPMYRPKEELLMSKPVPFGRRLAIPAFVAFALLFVSDESRASIPWSLRGDVSYLETLSSRQQWFQSDKSVFVVLRKLESQYGRVIGRGKSDFQLLVQTSPDSGIYRAMYWEKCGQPKCRVIGMTDLRISKVQKMDIRDFDLPCLAYPGAGPTSVNSGPALSLGGLSNYSVCRKSDKVFRSGISGGSRLPGVFDKNIKVYVRDTYIHPIN